MPLILGFLSFPLSTVAARADSVPSLKPRIEANLRAGTERSIVMTEAWVPLAQRQDRVLYGDARLMGDDGDNREWNFGLGYRDLAGDGGSVMGVHGWVDRRRTERGSVFHQVTGGVEYMSQKLDIRLNGYMPFNEKETYAIDSGGSATPYLADTGIFYDTDGQLVERPMHGMDLEFSVPVPFLEEKIESFRVSAGAFIFDGKDLETMRGARLRAKADITPDFSVGTRFDTDNQRGSQGFAEVTLRFPFGSKASQKTLGLRGRLDESPERDIDVVAASQVTAAPSMKKPVLNAAAGTAQRVFHVDNTAAAGGDGSLDRPFNTLADASAAASQAGDVIYINRGDGTSAGMDQGVTVSSAGQSLIGSGSAFVYDGGRFSAPAGQNFSGIVLRAAGTAPTLSNTNPNGDGITVAAADVAISGVTVDGAARNGIYAAASGGDDLGTLTLRNITLENNAADGLHVEASGAGSVIDAALSDVRAEGNHNGIRYYAASDASVTGAMERSVATANAQHGVIVYDDSAAGSVDVDLGGGARSDGLNGLYGNDLEDLAVELDGATLTAQNNWWGQASGPDADSPATGIAPQIYYGAPLDDGLIGHWTFDSEWTTNTTAYDRSGNGYDGTMFGGMTVAGNSVAGAQAEALNFDGVNDAIQTGNVDLTATDVVTVSMWRNVSVFTNSTGIEFELGNNYNSSALGFVSTLDDGTSCIGKVHSGIVGNVGRNLGCYARPATNVWVHVVMIFDKGVPSPEQEVYYNSVLQVRINQGSTFNNTNTFGNLPFNIMSRGATSLYARDKIDDVRIYDRALSPTEIAELYSTDSSSVVNTAGALSAAP